MAGQGNQIQSVELRPFYLKDIKRLSRIVAEVFPNRTLSEWKEVMGDKRDRGETLHFLMADGQEAGGVNVTAPFGSPTWRIMRIHTTRPLNDSQREELVRQLVEEDDQIYRIDTMYTFLTEEDRRLYGRLTGIDWPVERATYFAPMVARREIAFIPWEFGFLAAVTTPDRQRISAIEFVRAGGEGLSVEVRQAAYYQGLLSHDGSIRTPENFGQAKESPVLEKARAELRHYLNGGHEISLPYEFPKGTAFQMEVWKETLKIPYGAVKTYAEIAGIIQPDKDKAGQMARAVGRALAVNPLPIIIPCHRVIGSNRSLTGFGGGVDIKDHLLQLEMWSLARPS